MNILEPEDAGFHYDGPLLCIAAQNDNPAVLRVVFNMISTKERATALLTSIDAYGNTPLHLAADKKNPESLRIILSLIPVEERVNALLHTKKNCGVVPIESAVEHHNRETIRFIFFMIPPKDRKEFFKAAIQNASIFAKEFIENLIPKLEKEAATPRIDPLDEPWVIIDYNETTSPTVRPSLTASSPSTTSTRVTATAKPAQPAPTRQPSSLSAVEQERMDAERDRAHAASTTPATHGTTSTLFITGQRPAVRRPQRPESFYERALGQTPPSTAAAASSRPAESAAQGAARVEAILRNVDAAQGPITASGRPITTQRPAASSSSSSTAAAGAWRTGGGSPR